MFQCIYLQCRSARKQVCGYPFGTCNTFSSFKHATLQVCVQSLQRRAHFSHVLYVKLLELEFVFRFFRHKPESIEELRLRLRGAEVSRLFINRYNFVPGSLMALAIADLIYYPFTYYPSNFVCKHAVSSATGEI